MRCLLASMLFAALTVGVQQQTGVPNDARSTIAAANAAWLPAMKAQDATAIAEPYADDGIFVGPTGAVATGRDGVARLMRERFARTGRVKNGQLAQDGMTRQGAFIYEWGHATLELEGQGGPLQSRGRYLTVWRKNAAGRWQIIRNLSLPD